MSITHTRDFVDYAPLMAVLVAVSVALMQYYLQRQQKKQQLFDKRFAVYLRLRKFLSGAMKRHGEPLDNAAYEDFFEDMRPARFLFGPDVLAYISRIHREISHEEDSEGNDMLRVGWEDDDPFIIHMKWGRDAELIFRPYLQIHYDKSWIARFFGRLNRWVNQEQPVVLASRYKD